MPFLMAAILVIFIIIRLNKIDTSDKKIKNNILWYNRSHIGNK